MKNSTTLTCDIDVDVPLPVSPAALDKMEIPIIGSEVEKTGTSDILNLLDSPPPPRLSVSGVNAIESNIVLDGGGAASAKQVPKRSSGNNRIPRIKLLGQRGSFSQRQLGNSHAYRATRPQSCISGQVKCNSRPMSTTLTGGPPRRRHSATTKSILITQNASAAQKVGYRRAKCKTPTAAQARVARKLRPASAPAFAKGSERIYSPKKAVPASARSESIISTDSGGRWGSFTKSTVSSSRHSYHGGSSGEIPTSARTQPSRLTYSANVVDKGKRCQAHDLRKKRPSLNSKPAKPRTHSKDPRCDESIGKRNFRGRYRTGTLENLSLHKKFKGQRQKCNKSLGITAMSILGSLQSGSVDLCSPEQRNVNMDSPIMKHGLGLCSSDVTDCMSLDTSVNSLGTEESLDFHGTKMMEGLNSDFYNLESLNMEDDLSLDSPTGPVTTEPDVHVTDAEAMQKKGPAPMNEAKMDGTCVPHRSFSLHEAVQCLSVSQEESISAVDALMTMSSDTANYSFSAYVRAAAAACKTDVDRTFVDDKSILPLENAHVGMSATVNETPLNITQTVEDSSVWCPLDGMVPQESLASHQCSEAGRNYECPGALVQFNALSESMSTSTSLCVSDEPDNEMTDKKQMIDKKQVALFSISFKGNLNEIPPGSAERDSFVASAREGLAMSLCIAVEAVRINALKAGSIIADFCLYLSHFDGNLDDMLQKTLSNVQSPLHERMPGLQCSLMSPVRILSCGHPLHFDVEHITDIDKGEVVNVDTENASECALGGKALRDLITEKEENVLRAEKNCSVALGKRTERKIQRLRESRRLSKLKTAAAEVAPQGLIERASRCLSATKVDTVALLPETAVSKEIEVKQCLAATKDSTNLITKSGAAVRSSSNESSKTARKAEVDQISTKAPRQNLAQAWLDRLVIPKNETKECIALTGVAAKTVDNVDTVAAGTCYSDIDGFVVDHRQSKVTAVSKTSSCNTALLPPQVEVESPALLIPRIHSYKGPRSVQQPSAWGHEKQAQDVSQEICPQPQLQMQNNLHAQKCKDEQKQEKVQTGQCGERGDQVLRQQTREKPWYSKRRSHHIPSHSRSTERSIQRKPIGSVYSGNSWDLSSPATDESNWQQQVLHMHKRDRVQLHYICTEFVCIQKLHVSYFVGVAAGCKGAYKS